MIQTWIQSPFWQTFEISYTQLHTYNHGGSMYEFSFLYENIRKGLPYKDDEKQEKYLDKGYGSTGC